MSETKIREEICRLGRSLFDRGLTPGSSGNISVRLDDGGWLVTPTNASLGSLLVELLSFYSHVFDPKAHAKNRADAAAARRRAHRRRLQPELDVVPVARLHDVAEARAPLGTERLVLARLV